MIAAPPRKNANGDSAIRPYRTGELGHARPGLLLEDRDRAAGPVAHAPLGIGGSRYVHPQRAAGIASFVVSHGQPPTVCQSRTTHRVLIVLSVLIVALGAAACSDDNVSSQSPSFDGKALTVAGSAGCNSYSAPFVARGSNLTIGPDVATTQRACEPGPTSVERGYLANLVDVTSYAIDGDTLTLTGRSGQRLLVYRVSEGKDALAGGWNATSIYTGNAIESTVASSALTLEFADGRASGNTGCNTFSGDFTTAGADRIKIGPLATTRRACIDPAVSTQEQQYTAALELAETYQVTGDQLTLFRPGGTIAATFERATGLTSGS